MITQPNQRIKELISESGITNYILAKETGLSQATISRIVRGEQKAGRKSLKAIAEFFEVNNMWLTTGKGEKTSKNPQFNPPSIEELIIDKLYHRIAPIVKQNQREQKEEIQDLKKLIQELNKKIDSLI